MLKRLIISVFLLSSIFTAIPSSASLIEYTSIGAFRDTEPLDGDFDDGVYVNNSNTAWFPVHRSTTSSDAARTAFEFDLSQFSSIISAFLTIPYSFAINTPTLELHGYEGDGIVVRSDVLHENLLDIVQLSDSWNEPLQYIQFDVTPYVQSILDINMNYVGYSVRVLDDLTTNTTSVTNVWSGRIEHFISGFQSGPTLSIQPVPEPSTVALLGLSLVGLVGLVFRKKKKNKKKKTE